MTDSVFDQNTNKDLPPATIADKLKSIVNEKGEPKYDTPEKAIDALAHSQTHIARLEQEARTREAELATAREKAMQAEALEAVIERLKPTNQPEPPVTPQPSGLSEKATIQALEKIIEQRDQRAKAEANVKDVQNTLIAKFGDKTRETVAAKAASLGMTTEELGALSSKNPQLVLSLFGEVQKIVQPVTPSGITTPMKPTEDEPLAPPTKSLLLGATSKEQKEYFMKVKAATRKRLGVTE